MDREKLSEDNKWRIEIHSHQIADTGDYDGFLELTNGHTSLHIHDDYYIEEFEGLLEQLNNLELKVSNPLEGQLHYEMEHNKLLVQELRDTIKELEKEINYRYVNAEVTMVVPESCWLHPYIGYKVKYNLFEIIVDGDSYPDENYLSRGYIKLTQEEE